METDARGFGSERIRQMQVAAVITLVVGVPVILGGVLLWSRCLMVAAVAALVAVEWVPRTLMGCWPDRWERAWLAMWLVVSAVILLQLVPLPSWVSSVVGAYPDGFRELADIPIVRLSPTPQATAGYWAVFSCYWAVAWMVARFRRRDVARLAAALVALAVFEAFYGLYALAHDFESILGIWPKKQYLTDATGTYVNRNHFAGLLALCWPLGTAWILLPSSKSRPRLPPVVRQGLAILFALLIGTAIFGSHSRLGLLAAFGGLMTWLLLSHRQRRSEKTGAHAPSWIYAAIPAVAVVGAIWLGSGPLIERVIRITHDTDRFVVWSSLLDLPGRTWVLGAGAGSFLDVFKTVQPARLRTSYAYAHNDWLEFLVEFGLIGTAAIALVGWIWWRRVRPAHLGALHAGALGGLAAIAIHSAADFNLHIPGTAMGFWAVVGLVTNRRLANRTVRGNGQPRQNYGVAVQ